MIVKKSPGLVLPGLGYGFEAAADKKHITPKGGQIQK